ncbi:MAG TPA: SufD family Fe-S cluster assembly protein, partial [Ignavibacteriaceae bacterium]
NNKAQMIVDPGMPGLVAIISGNEIHISKELYDHPNVTISNSLENKNQNSNPRSLYNPDVFSTMAYLVCQNHTMFHIVGDVDEPIYLRYRSDYETFYNSVIVVEINDKLEVEIVEEIESCSALNAVNNYILHPTAKLNLTTFYQNHVSGISFFFRNIIAQDDSNYSHIVFGKGSSNIIDENKIHAHHQTKSEFLGIVNSDGKKFHSILFVQPASEKYSVNVDYRDILSGKSDVSFFPVILGQEPTDSATITVSNVILEEMPEEEREEEIKKYIGDIIERATLERMVGVKRFYDNKTKFLHFP